MWGILLPLTFLEADQQTSPHLEKIDKTLCPVAQYHLIDLGETDLGADKITRFDRVFSLAPSINDLGIILMNHGHGVRVRDPAVGEYEPKINGVHIFGHDINNKGDMIFSINRGSASNIEWVLWKRKKLRTQEIEKLHIGNLNLTPYQVYLTGLNDNDFVVGYQKSDDTLFPVEWTPCRSLNHLGYFQGLDAKGFAMHVNNWSTVAGYFDDGSDISLFIWNEMCGFDVLRNYRTMLACEGWIELADMLLSEDGVVFGTYKIKYISKNDDPNKLNTAFAYEWIPALDTFRKLDLKGMRIGSINSANTLVGSLNGKAALRRLGEEPVLLSSLLPLEYKDWNLIEATDINDGGQIIGYGLFQGKMHYFLFERISGW